MIAEYDAVIVGAGFSGAVVAERLASRLNWRVLILEQRRHIGGNCYDELDEHGVLVHRYGPHLFHTSKREVWEYLGRFTSWRPYEHKVLASVDGRLLPVPFNLNSLHACFAPGEARALEDRLIAAYGAGAKVPILTLRESDDTALKVLAEYIYDKIFVNYTCKQWGCGPEEISPAVTARVPVVISRDDRYFHDPHQGVPEKGYTELFKSLLADRRIDLRCGMACEEILSLDHENGEIRASEGAFGGHFIYTGMLDALFDYRFGELPYRSLRFEFEHLPQARFQPATTVNYPNDEDFTRITEFKHLTGQTHPGTSIVREYPQNYDRKVAAKAVPYYPFLTEANQARHRRYHELASKFAGLITLGRLADYRYYNMDDAVANALAVFGEIRERVNNASYRKTVVR